MVVDRVRRVLRVQLCVHGDESGRILVLEHITLVVEYSCA